MSFEDIVIFYKQEILNEFNNNVKDNNNNIEFFNKNQTHLKNFKESKQNKNKEFSKDYLKPVKNVNNFNFYRKK